MKNRISEIENIGWHKDMDAGVRRSLILKACGGDMALAVREMEALADVAKDKGTMREALKDVNYFKKRPCRRIIFKEVLASE